MTDSTKESDRLLILLRNLRGILENREWGEGISYHNWCMEEQLFHSLEPGPSVYSITMSQLNFLHLLRTILFYQIILMPPHNKVCVCHCVDLPTFISTCTCVCCYCPSCIACMYGLWSRICECDQLYSIWVCVCVRARACVCVNMCACTICNNVVHFWETG